MSTKVTVIGLWLLLPSIVLSQSPPAAVRAGTAIRAKLETTVNTATSQAGDEVVASLAQNVLSSDAVVVPRGSLLRGRVETIQSATLANEGHLRLVFREIQLPNGQRVQTWITNSFAAATPNRNARYILYMALGGVAGGLIGGKTARAAGVIGGVLTGFVIAGNQNSPRVRNLVLKRGRQIRLEFREDLAAPAPL